MLYNICNTKDTKYFVNCFCKLYDFWFLVCVLQLCVEFILCNNTSIHVIEYNIGDDKCALTAKQIFNFGKKYDREDPMQLPLAIGQNYNGYNCGMCVLSNMSEYNSESEFKLNDDISNDLDHLEEEYDIILFGGFGSFLSSLKWFSLKIVNNESYIISMDNDKTKQLQNTFVDETTNGNHKYDSFGYTKWKRYLILFGGRMDSGSNNVEAIDSIFYFDIFEMKWHKSLQV